MNIIQVYKQFPSQDSCLDHLEKVRWKGAPICPYCNSNRQTPLKKESRYHCNSCNRSYAVTVGTIFHNTKMDLQKWFLAISLVLNAKKGISARQLARDIEVNKNTAWFMLMRIRKAMMEQGELLSGIVEADETYIGGKAKNKHKDKRPKGGQGRNTKNKTPVIGVLERGGKIRAKKSKDVKGRTLKSFVNANVQQGSIMCTDEWGGYNKLSQKFTHLVVKHGEGEYVQGQAHTNSIEGFWSLFKRGIVGQYHQISRRYIDRYIDEFCFRYNYREDENVFALLVSRCLGVSVPKN